MYVIKKGRLYVAEPGNHNSYTNKLQYAQTYPTKEQAEVNKCGNEYVVPVFNEIK